MKLRKRAGWFYQLALSVTLRSRRSGKVVYMGKPYGSKASSNYACSAAHAELDFQQCFDEAIRMAYSYVYDEQTGSTDEVIVGQGWEIVNDPTKNMHFLLHRNFKRMESGERMGKIRANIKDLPIASIVKKPTKKELEEKYKTPKRTADAWKNLRKKNIAIEKRKNLRKGKRK
jgi:hypothetical protein